MVEMEANSPTLHVGRQGLDPTSRGQTCAVHPLSLRWTRMPLCRFPPFSGEPLTIPLMPDPCCGSEALLGVSRQGSGGAPNLLVTCRNNEFLCAFQRSMGART